MRQANEALTLSGSSMAVDITSGWILMDQNTFIAIQMKWTGTPVGNFTIETSCDHGTDQFGAGVTVIDPYTGSSQAAGGAAGTFTYRVSDLGDRWIRLKYTHSSGSGTLTSARFNLKGF